MNFSKTVALHTLGCRLNQFETEAIATRLIEYGYTIVPFEDKTADYVIINTCTVTHKADRKSRSSIYRSLSPAQTSTDRALPDKKKTVIVTGCYVGSGSEWLQQSGVDYLVDNSKKKYIPELIHSHTQGHSLDLQSLDANYFDYSPTKQVFHTRGTLKVQDGCDNFCSFCIIPLVRGAARSRSLRHILEDARIMIAGGSTELVVSGVNISRYQVEEDNTHYGFSDLIEKLLSLDGNFRLRISSMEPDTIDDKFFDLMTHPKLCPHLHLCLQSGSDRILLKMKRMYTSDEYRRIVTAIRKRNPYFCITTDAIVGYPGESEQDFESTCALIKELDISHVHIFPYSARSGTRSSRLVDTDAATKKTRIQALQILTKKIKHDYRKRMAQQPQTLLVERSSHDPLTHTSTEEGLSEFYIPIRRIHHNLDPKPQGSFVSMKNFDIEYDNDRKEPILIHRLPDSKTVQDSPLKIRVSP